MDGRYDWDAATSANFLRKYGLIGEFYILVAPILLVNVSIISLGVSVESQKSPLHHQAPILIVIISGIF